MTEQSFNTDWGFSSCFGCGPENPIGLKLVFRKDGENTVGTFTPTGLHQGWSGLVHGGIILCLLDEAMAYAARFETGDIPCVTARIQAKLKRSTPIDIPLVITAKVTGKNKRLIETSSSVCRKDDGTLIADGTATQFIVKSAGKKEPE